MSLDAMGDSEIESALASALSVSSALISDADAAEFRVTIAELPPALAGAKLRLRLGSVTIMLLQMPVERQNGPLHYGPTRLPLAKLRRQREFDLAVSYDSGSPPFRCKITRLSGDLLEALSLPTRDAFFNKIQLNHRRYKNPMLLLLGAIAAYGRFPDFDVRAAALTIPAHRLLEKDFRSFDDDDRALMRWICEEGLRVVEEGAAELARTTTPDWTLVRWTVSLATVCGLLSICQDRLAEATKLFGLAAAQTDHVTISPVSALNLVNACLIHGLLLAADGQRDLARATLERGVQAFPKCAMSQDVMRNIWVLGDLLNVCRASRTCFIALGRIGLLQPKSEPQMNETDTLDLAQVKSPLHDILKAGLAPRLLLAIQDIANRRLDPGIAA